MSRPIRLGWRSLEGEEGLLLIQALLFQGPPHRVRGQRVPASFDRCHAKVPQPCDRLGFRFPYQGSDWHYCTRNTTHECMYRERDYKPTKNFRPSPAVYTPGYTTPGLAVSRSPRSQAVLEFVLSAPYAHTEAPGLLGAAARAYASGTTHDYRAADSMASGRDIDTRRAHWQMKLAARVQRDATNRRKEEK